jgi:hypothetical protein
MLDIRISDLMDAIGDVYGDDIDIDLSLDLYDDLDGGDVL